MCKVILIWRTQGIVLGEPSLRTQKNAKKFWWVLYPTEFAIPKIQGFAKETLEIYVPIALRLGMNKLRLELEEISFRTLNPLRYKIIKNAVEAISNFPGIGKKTALRLVIYLQTLVM